MTDSKSKSTRRVLMVDDDAQWRTILGLTLASKGYDVAHAGNGTEAIAMHHKNPFDVVVIEMVMPEKDGFETLVELKTHSSPPKLIAMAGQRRLSSELYLTMAKHLGAHQLLAKPFQPEQLLAAVRSVLGEI